jgi:hypothetical protein
MNWDAATTGLLAAVVFVACFFAVYIPLRRALLRKAIYDCFAKYAPVEGDKYTLDAIAIDVDWVALTLCGFPVETRIRKLPPADEARVSIVSERVIHVANAMVKSGHLRFFAVAFENKGKNQKINEHPPTLFMLAPKGRAEVVKILGKGKQ